MCARDFKGPAYSYPNLKKRSGCFCDPLCAYRYIYDTDARNKGLAMTYVKYESRGVYLLPPACLLRHFGGPLSYEKWKRKQCYWEAPLCPRPRTVCVLNNDQFSTIKKPVKKLGHKLF